MLSQSCIFDLGGAKRQYLVARSASICCRQNRVVMEDLKDELSDIVEDEMIVEEPGEGAALALFR